MALVENGPELSHPPTTAHADTETSALAHHLNQSLARQLREAALRAGPLAITDPVTRHDPSTSGPVMALSSSGRMREFRGRLAKPETAAALTLASFLPWLTHAAELPLAGLDGFRELHFDARCPTGVRGTPPVIDFMASGPNGVVGAAVHVFEYLVPRPRRVSPAYAGLELPAGLRVWAPYLQPDPTEPSGFRHLDTAAVAKLAVGLGRIFSGRPVRLLYLFLEPQGAPLPASFGRHRAELARLIQDTAGGDVLLVPMSFHELWAFWQDQEDLPQAVRGVVAELGRRYAVAMPAMARL